MSGNATDTKRELIDPVRLNSYAAIDLIMDKKWCPRVKNMAVAIETNDAYLGIHFPEEISYQIGKASKCPCLCSHFFW